MALRHILAFDHIPNVSTTSAAQFTKALGNLPLVTRGGAGNNKSFVFGGPENGLLTCGLTAGVTTASWILNSQRMVKGTPKISVFGGRMKIINLGSPPSGDQQSAMVIADNSWAMTTTDNRVQVFQLINLLNSGETLSSLNGQERYLEIKFDWVNKIMYRRVDGQDISDIEVPSFLHSQFNARNIGLFLNAAGGANCQWGWRDIYWIDDTEDDSLNDYLGPQRVVPVTGVVEDAPGWVASAGTPNSVINTAVTTTSPDTPTVASPADLSPMVIGLNMSDVDAGRVNGITVLPAVGRPSGSASKINFSLKIGDSESAVRTLTPGTTIVHSQVTEAFEHAPDGTLWSVGKVNAAKLNVTPSI